MIKSQLRAKYKNLRFKLTSEDVAQLSIKIANNCLKLSIWHFQYYHVFLPIAANHEIDTTYLLSILQGKDKDIIVPKANFADYTLDHILLTDSTKLNFSSFGIPEPENGLSVPVQEIQLVFVPLLAYDRHGSRVGYGKGFYDRFLMACNNDCLKIGLSFFEPEEIIEDVDQLDVKLDYCVTPLKIYKFD
jgi:5-formyltetrahydrofolate cyclo-ligase